MDISILFVSLKQWIPTLSVEEAQSFIAENCGILDEEGREIFFALSDLFCTENGVSNSWFVQEEQRDDVIVYKCDSSAVPHALSFILFKYLQKHLEMLK